MKKETPFLIVLLLLLPACLFSQHLMGKITEKDSRGREQPLPMAGVTWIGTRLTATSDSLGNFHIPFPDTLPAKLLVHLISYRNDTLLFTDRSRTFVNVILKNEATTLGVVNITGKSEGSAHLITSPMNMEKISRKELTLAACCNLSESFERNASVDVNFTDAVSGTKQIQMLGLDGIYTQILYENLPFVHGLSSSNGLSYIPGPWVESILVTKGTGSVLNGYEPITGQIQIELLEPDNAEKLLVNGYASSQQRYELNAHYTHRFSENLGTVLFAHVNKNILPMDRNGDSFLDEPLATQYNFLNRWHYRIKDKAEGQFGIRALIEDKTAGQRSELLNDTSAGSSPYTIGIRTRQFETFTKNGLLFPEKPWKSVAIMTTERFHSQDAYFGNKKYNGEQRSLYVNTIWQGILGNTFHKIKSGASLVLDDYREKFNGGSVPSDSMFNSQQVVPGAYAEYTYNNDTNLSVVAGVRGDYLKDEGVIADPRLHLKYNPWKGNAIRITGGRGFRSPHIFAENSAVFASSRKIIVEEKLKPEIAWNYGVTFTQKYRIRDREASVNLDFFRTDFQSQVVMDLEDAHSVRFYNLKGVSYSNAFQTDLTFPILERLDLKLAYKYYDVKETYSGKLLDKPLVPKNRALANLDYATNMEKWKFDLTLKWFGESRLPNTSAGLPEFRLPEKSTAYYTVMAQITKRFRRIEVYAGVENLLDYRQPNPIVDPGNPFGRNFDASMIWGPIAGRVVYGGFRYKIQ